MKLYVTCDSIKKITESFLGLWTFSIINVQEIVEFLGYDLNNLNEYRQFIINEEIANRIKESIIKKRYKNILYINSNLNIKAIENLKELVETNDKLTKLVLITEKNANIDIYPLFDELIFYPSYKRVKILQCEPIKSPLFYWIHNKDMPTNTK